MRYARLFSSMLVCFAAACTANSGDDAVQGASQDLTECDATGTWAIKVETPVKWNASFVLQGGTGTITNWLLSQRTQAGTQITDTARICGVETPDYQAAAMFGNEKFGVKFPDAAFEKLPAVTLSGTLSSKELGATYSSPASAALVGATLTDPAKDPWPANVAAIVSQDADGDGKPGVSGEAKADPGYSLPPVNVTRTVRANRVYTAFRQVLETTSGTVKSCTRVDGKGTIATLGGKAAIDTHVLGCTTSAGAECNAAEFKLLDSAAPVYQPTGEAVITMVKLPDATATCATVRALDFAAQP